MSKLRDQYKIQQQNLMKLLELLEVGNCLHVIEAECSRTESMIFDSEIVACELDVQPNVHDGHSKHELYCFTSSYALLCQELYRFADNIATCCIDFNIFDENV